MRELKSNDKIDIKFNNKIIHGVVQKIEYDRVKISILPEYKDIAKFIQELDELEIMAHTRMGLKKMVSSVIDRLDKLNAITVENNDTIDVEQKRKFVRVVCDFLVDIEKEKKKFQCKAIDISACGMAVHANEKVFQKDDNVIIDFPKEIFGKDIKIEGKIVKMNDLNYGIAYHNLNEYDENIIMKYVFKTISYNNDAQE